VADDSTSSSSHGMYPQQLTGSPGVVARSGLPTVELGRSPWAPRQAEDGGSGGTPQSRDQRSSLDAQELRTASLAELHERMTSLQATYDHLNMLDEEEEDPVREEAEMVLQRLQQTQDILSTVSISDRIDSIRASSMGSLLAPLGADGQPVTDGDPLHHLKQFMQTQPMARKLAGDDLAKLQGLVTKEKTGAGEVEKMTRELLALKGSVGETESELTSLSEDLRTIKQEAIDKHQELTDLKLEEERLNSELRGLSSQYAAFDKELATAAGFKFELCGLKGFHRFQSPKGPIMLVSAQPATSGEIRWKLRMTGNASWALGLVPEHAVKQPDYLFTDATVGVNSSGTARTSQLPRHAMHETTIEVLIDLDKCTAKFLAVGEETMPVVQTFDPSIKGDRGVRLAVTTFVEVQVELYYS